VTQVAAEEKKELEENGKKGEEAGEEKN